MLTEDSKCTTDIKKRLGLASAMFGRLGKLWTSKEISRRTKIRLHESFVFPVLTYGSECWCLKKEDAAM